MKHAGGFILAVGALLLLQGAASSPPRAQASKSDAIAFKVQKTEAEWRKILTPQQYHVLREKGTECALTGAFWDNHEQGDYFCAGCGQHLFSSTSKYDSGTGWPSFFRPVSARAVITHEDRSHGMDRTEINCSRCGGHLGHVFPDGPPPSGLRYCTNSAAFKFVAAKKR